MLSSEYEGRTVVVTGAARGIGRNIAASFANAGAHVVVVDRNGGAAQELKKEVESKGGKMSICVFDLADTDGIVAFLGGLIEQFGWVDVLVNNARAGSRTPALEETPSNYESTFDVVLKAPLFASQYLIREARERNQRACILNISSILATTVSMESASYHLAKAALESMTRYLAVHGGECGVRVNAIRPGLIIQDEYQERFWSESNRRYRKVAETCHPLGTVGSSNDVAESALFLCSNRAAFITGHVLSLDGGIQNHEPFTLLNAKS